MENLRKLKSVAVDVLAALAIVLSLAVMAFAGEEPMIEIHHCGPGIFVTQFMYDEDKNGVHEYIRLETGKWKEPFAEIWFYNEHGGFKRAKILRLEIAELQGLRDRVMCDDARMFFSMKSQEKEI